MSRRRRCKPQRTKRLFPAGTIHLGRAGFLSTFNARIYNLRVAKSKTQFLCNHCGSVHPKWMGKCPDCGTWDSLEEYKQPTFDARAAARDSGRTATGEVDRGGEPVAIDAIDDADAPRIAAGIGEFDRILGGGIVPGS